MGVDQKGGTMLFGGALNGWAHRPALEERAGHAGICFTESIVIYVKRRNFDYVLAR